MYAIEIEGMINQHGGEQRTRELWEAQEGSREIDENGKGERGALPGSAGSEET
jgi:hypothetical protein